MIHGTPGESLVEWLKRAVAPRTGDQRKSSRALADVPTTSGRNGVRITRRAGLVGTAAALLAPILAWRWPGVRTARAAGGDPTLPLFTDVAPAWGMNQVSHGYGGNTVDYDQDGLVDVLFPNHQDITTLFHQSPAGHFTDVAPTSGIALTGYDRHGASWGDLDNDGHLDLYMALGFGEVSRLYWNQGNNTFVDIGPQSGATVSSRGRGVAWIDYNNDGFLDIHCCTGHETALTSKLFHNNGNRTFTDVSATAGDLTRRFHHYGQAWADYDNDGFMDCFTSSGNQLAGDTAGLDKFCNLYHNNGNGSFTDVNAAAGIIVEPTIGMAWGDYNNDGYLDLFVASSPTNRLYRNNKNGTFTEVAVTAGVDRSLSSQDAVWADINNDGYLDLYVVNAGDQVNGGQPNFLYLNQGNGTFRDVAAQVGAQGNLKVGGGVAGSDIDGDGFVDLAIVDGLSTNPSTGPHQVLHNGGNRNKWLKVWLVGVQSNRLGTGARVVVKGDNGLALSRWATGGTHHYSQDDLTLHFGLADSLFVLSLTIYWPSGIVQTLTNIAVNQLLRVVESGSSPPTVTPSMTSTATLTPNVTATRTPTPTQTPRRRNTRTPTPSHRRTQTSTPTSTPTPGHTDRAP